eukprot:scaffold216049_cov47-Prasinocladus_malaysianus.AAC.1
MFPAAKLSFELAASHGNADGLYSLACLLERQIQALDATFIGSLQLLLLVCGFFKQATNSEAVISMRNSQ